MNTLTLHTVATEHPDTFLVYWSNSIKRTPNALKVQIKAQIEDKNIAAELSAMQHLLEVKNVLGENSLGNPNMKLTVSLGAIRKLHHQQSDKVHLIRYANFLTTRFAGSVINVDKDQHWFKDAHLGTIESLVIDTPRLETIQVVGLGEVGITKHVLDRLGERVLEDPTPQGAWKRLVKIASDRSIVEVARQAKWSPRNGQEGRYFMSATRKLVLVVTDKPGEGKRLVTTYPANHQFCAMRKAA